MARYQGRPRANKSKESGYRSDVSRDGNRITFERILNPVAHIDALMRLHELEVKGYDDCVLDFSRITGAFTDGVVPLIASVTSFRSRGVRVRIILPGQSRLSDLFLNTNWAYYLDPATFWRAEIAHGRHLATQQFVTAQEQKAAVDTLLDVLMKKVETPREQLQALEWAVNEITDNVLNHAESPDGGFVQATALKDCVVFSVADTGMGILSSLRQGLGWLRDDGQALGEAVKAGVTRGRQYGMGNGLAGTLKLSTYSGGDFSIMSGRARLAVHPDRRGRMDTARRSLPRNTAYHGTVVSANIRRTADERMREALGLTATLHGSFDHIDAAYTTADGDALVLRLATETAGVGSRHSGREIRTKCINLLNADPVKPLILDWSGVPVIASSFADELVGYLFAELGPLTFAARVRNKGMESLVKQLLDKAILDRMRPH
jgi:anti-sigma regulatory factor (Ser/Thr protein kinase)